MSNHTPGPWSVMWQNLRERNFGGGVKHWEVPVQVGERGNGGNVIAIVYIGGVGATDGGKDAVSANARLIQASPDLLEACIALQSEAKARGCGLRIADEAIAKATNKIRCDRCDGNGIQENPIGKCEQCNGSGNM
jgi:hypothetical protein